MDGFVGEIQVRKGHKTFRKTESILNRNAYQKEKTFLLDLALALHQVRERKSEKEKERKRERERERNKEKERKKEKQKEKEKNKQKQTNINYNSFFSKYGAPAFRTEAKISAAAYALVFILNKHKINKHKQKFHFRDWLVIVSSS